ncbi:ABC transporter substrate-binding protein [Celeribacter indicus]|uniref:NMT1/THI5-like domain-containing protein n=1 Tax=Celeribacter indicus TaxID=1208324 RepID=A0A0B5DUZ6_9RHOB|nr:ABC transporter substrate-binding protein [Celeribacter indicus]AJE46849.1 NMT1/THI5-like domain-containing protein [Celeribacter indicus]SDW80360.1 NitT/TauT family transport system substrate-binding protein [Celeribacter indicus]
MKPSAVLVFALATTGLTAPAVAQDPQPLTIAVGTSVLNVGYPMLTLPVTLGYWEEEGYEVSVEPVGASLQALQQMVAGNAAFAQVNASVIVQGNVVNDLPVKVAMANGVIDWSVSVPADSDIAAPQDLKGKTIGVFSLATGGIPLMNSWLASEGLDPQTDLELIPLGLGAAPVEALRTGDVDALLYWASATAGFENAGLELRQLASDTWAEYPDYSLAVMADTVESDPDMVVGIARGIAKATVFALENPECAVKLHWQNYPETKPTGADEETLLAWDLNNINAQLATLKAGFELNGGEIWGTVDPDGFDRLQSFLQETGVIDGTVDPASYLVEIEDYAAQVNDFDAEAIRAAARDCAMVN